jgi:hypothetical protein
MAVEVPPPVAEVARLMAAYTGAWALCGGWAVDAWLGRVTRDHADVDIAVFLDQLDAVFEELAADWGLVAHETDEADHHITWDGHPLAFPSHLHAGDHLEPKRELQVNERADGTWVLRRSPRVTLPGARFALQSAWGLPVLAPEALLFYKSLGEHRPHDEEDLANLLPHLDERQRAWLDSVLSAR